ncbi:MAG: hypothetical protein H2057_01340 [Alphaproteobacteria bacterium]|nr:hypothetical protein [Alphaproteobacteria bacterium]
MSHRSYLFYTLVFISSSIGIDIVHGTDEGDRLMSPLHTTQHRRLPHVIEARDKSPLRSKSPQTSPRDNAETDNRRFPVIVPSRVGKVHVVVGKLEDESSYEMPLVDTKNSALVFPKKSDTPENDLQNSASSSLKEVGSFDNIDFDNLTTALCMLKENEQKPVCGEDSNRALAMPTIIHNQPITSQTERRKSPRPRSLVRPLKPEDISSFQEGGLPCRTLKPLDLGPIAKAHVCNQRLTELSKRVRGSAKSEEGAKEGALGIPSSRKSPTARVPHLPVEQIMSHNASGSGTPSPLSTQRGLSLEHVSILTALDTFDKRKVTFLWDLEQQKERNIILKDRTDRPTEKVYGEFKSLDFKKYYQEVGQGKKDAITHDAPIILRTLLYIADDFEEALKHYTDLDKGRFSDNILIETSKTLEHLHKFFEGYSMMLALLHTSVWSVTSRHHLASHGLLPEKLASAQLTYVVGMSSVATLMQDFKESIEARRSQLRAQESEGSPESKESHSSGSATSYVAPQRKKASPSAKGMSSFSRTDSSDVLPSKKARRKSETRHGRSSHGEEASLASMTNPYKARTPSFDQEHKTGEGAQKKPGIGSKLIDAFFQ